jgi:hypothetical protein
LRCFDGLHISGYTRYAHTRYIQNLIYINANSYVNKSSGAENTNNSFCATDFIEVSNIISITTTVYIYGNAGVCIYDENKALIKGYGSDFSVATKITLAIEISIGAKYIRFSTIKAHKTDFFYDNNSLGSDIKKQDHCNRK